MESNSSKEKPLGADDGFLSDDDMAAIEADIMRKIADEEQANKGHSRTVQGTSIIQENIATVEKFLEKVRTTFSAEKKRVQNIIYIWAFLSLLFSAILYCFYKDYLHLDNPSKINLLVFWTWQFIYFMVIKLALLSLFVSIITFCVKNLKSYMDLLEGINHKLAVIDSMPTLLHVPNNQEQSRIVFNKIFEMLIFSNFKSKAGLDSASVETISSLVEKVLDKKK